MVEALTIVLGVGIVRGWRSTADRRGRRGRSCWRCSSRCSGRRCGTSRSTPCAWSSARCCSSSACSGCARRSCARAATRRCTTRTRRSARERAEAAAAGSEQPRRARLVRVHGRLQGRPARGPRGRLHRDHLRQRAGPPRPGGRRRGRGARARRRRGRAGARPARARAREHDQVRGRPAADDLRHASGPPRAPASTGRATSSRCSGCSPSWPRSRSGSCGRCGAGASAPAGGGERMRSSARVRPRSGGTSSSATTGGRGRRRARARPSGDPRRPRAQRLVAAAAGGRAARGRLGLAAGLVLFGR